MPLRKWKQPRPNAKIDEPYKAFIRSLPCIVCFGWSLRIKGYHAFVECAHVGQRGLSQKSPDRETIPLCVWHHRLGPQSIHALGKRFWSYWRLSRPELIAEYNRKFEGVGRDAA